MVVGTVQLETRCLCVRALVPSGSRSAVSCSFSSTRGKNSSPQRQRGGGLPAPPPKTKRPPAFYRAGRVGRKRWSSQHVPPSHPEPKATVHSCTVRALTQDAVSFGYKVLVFARLCPLAHVVLFPVLFLLHGGRTPRLSAREEVGSPHLPPALRSPPRFKTRSRFGPATLTTLQPPTPGRFSTEAD